MKRHLHNEIKRNLKKDVQLPEEVERRIQGVYESIGVNKKTDMKYYKGYRKKRLCVIAAVVALAVVVGFGTKGKFSKMVQENPDTISYDFQIDYELTSYDVLVETGYIPEGFEQKEDGPFGGKIYNEESGEVITLQVDTAATLDIQILNGKYEFYNVKKVNKTVINNMDAHIITMKKNIKNMLLFNEKEGYVATIFYEGALDEAELKKVAENLHVKTLDTKTAFLSLEEKEKIMEQKEMHQNAFKETVEEGVLKENVFSIGEQLMNPKVEELSDTPNKAEETLDSAGDTRYTVKSVRVFDKWSETEYAKEYFYDFEGDIAYGLNKDGSIKPYKREARSIYDDRIIEKVETVNSKFVEVKMSVKNMRNIVSGEEDIVPKLKLMNKKPDGNLGYLGQIYVPEDNVLSGVHSTSDGDAIYFDKPYYTEGINRIKRYNFRTLEANEELEYTLLYTVDEDQISNMYLQFYPEQYYKNYTKRVECYVDINSAIQ